MEGIKADLKQVEKLISKLKAGELSRGELDALVLATQTLAEKSVILRYKAFEKMTGITIAPNEATIEKQDSDEILSEVKDEIFESQEQQEQLTEDSAFDFGIFEEEVEEELPAIEIDTTTEASETPVSIEEPTIDSSLVMPEEKVETPAENPMSASNTNVSFYDKLVQQDNSLAAKIAGGKIDSLIGAFGLNQRLQFINELFDGSSDNFSEAIKTLDAQHSLANAKNHIEQFAKQYNWSLEDESVSEFLVFVNRRYA